MSDDSIKIDGIQYTKVDIGERFGLTPEQLKTFTSQVMEQSSYRYGEIISQQQHCMAEDYRDISANIEAGKREFIANLAQASAEANAKAMRSTPAVFDKIIGALASLCGNPIFNTQTHEDPMNDYVRDVLGQEIEVRDQTRQGISGSSDSAVEGHAGEVDIQIRFNGKPICIYEGLKLDSVQTDVIYSHIAKATIKYNPQGLKEVFVVTYVVNQQKRFGDFWDRFKEKVRAYVADDDEYMIAWDDEDTDTGMSAIRVLHGVYKMDGEDHNVYAIAVKIQS